MGDIVVTFGPPTLGKGVVITSQYDGVPNQANGVDFLAAPPALPASSKIPAGGYATPVTRTPPHGAPGTQVAVLQAGGEFGTVSALGRFNSPHQHVGLLVGSVQNASPNLTAYDVDGNVVASATMNVTGGGGVHLNAMSSSATPNIMFFVLTGADNGIALWLTNLTYDEITTPTADFLLGNAYGITVVSGGSVTVPATLTRLGGSNGDIALAATPPPPVGVTLTLVPETVAGTGESFSLVIAATTSAAIGKTTDFTLAGTPASAAVGPQKRTAKGAYTVLAPFHLEVSGGYSASVVIAPCTPGTLVLDLLPGPGTPAGTVASITCTGQPSAVTCEITPASLTLPAYPTSPSVTLTFSTSKQPASTAPIPLTITAAIPGFSTTLKVTLTIAPTSITSVSSQGVYTPREGDPGSVLIITGEGFCQGTRVRFGNDVALATPTQITPTQIQVQTPRLATTGISGASNTNWSPDNPFGLLTPDGVAVGAPANITINVDSYRNVFGWPFHNYNVGKLTFDQLTELYGEDATHISTPTGEWRNPWASIYLAVVKAILDGNDLCFGLALATQRIKDNQWGAANAADLPSDNLPLHYPFTWLNPGRTSPNNTPAPQDDFIHVQHIAQYSDEWLGYYLNNSLSATPVSAATWRGIIQEDLSGDDFPLVCLRHSAGDGHTLVAYDIEENPADPAGFIIDVYDPNEEFTNAEDNDGSGQSHQTAFELSQIQVSGDGSWWFPFSADSWPPPSGTTWSGDAHSIIPGSTQIIPQIPSMPGIFSALWHALEVGAVAVFGSAPATPALQDRVTVTAGVSTVQLGDAAGRTLFQADGGLNTNQATRVAAAPCAFTTGTTNRGDIFVICPSGTYTHTVRGKASGSYGVMAVGRPFGVVLTCETGEGQEDAITLDAGGRAFSFITSAAAAALRAEVMLNGPDGSPRFATLLTRAGEGATHTLRFTADGASVVHEHGGDAAAFEIYLSALDRQGRRHAITSGPLTAGDGQTTTLTPPDWHDLGTVFLTQTGAASTRTLTAPPLVVRES